MLNFLLLVLVALLGIALFRVHRPLSYEDLGELPLDAQISFSLFIMFGLGVLIYVQSN